MNKILSKIPSLTLAFWVMKICATTLGETAGDLLSMTINVGYAVSSLILVGMLGVVLVAQVAATKYLPPLYWGVILLTSTAGTTMSDYMDRTLGLGYAEGAAILLTLLVFVLAIWKWSTGSLSVADVRTRKSEVFYWIAILFSNTLGTALGDFLADSSGLGFAGGAMLISGVLAVLLAAYHFTRVSRVALFWMAFILTRPLGATMGDVLTKTPVNGGLGFGTIGSSVVLATLLGVLVYQASRKERATI